LYPSPMAQKSEDPLIQQLRKVIKDGLDYLQSLLTLLQARTAEMVLSGVLFVVMLGLAILFGLIALILFNIIIGMWLAQVLGNPLWGIVILGAFYGIVAFLLGFKALNWLKNLKS
jgi:hypothetical protein